MKTENNHVTVIGITGTIGSGKSTVGKILTELGVPVIDTDKIVHRLLANDIDIKTEIKKHFPDAVSTDTSGKVTNIDRKKLGAIIFKDAQAKKQLELILHPRVRQLCQQQTEEYAESAAKPPIIAVLIPLLFENKLQSHYDQTWTIIAEDKILRQRLSQRDGLSSSDIELRLAGQMSQADKAKMADIVLDNSGTEKELHDKVQALIEFTTRSM